MSDDLPIGEPMAHTASGALDDEDWAARFADLARSPSSEAGLPLAEAVEQAFALDGPLAKADPHYVAREGQLQLAAAVAQALETRGSLVAEAGTGVGKTFAYLIPLLLSGRRALVSTATKSLQDQLFLRDLPRLREALNVPVTLALLKGRGSYLCLHRMALARETVSLADRFALRALARIEQWSQATASGDLAELDGLDERSPVIPLVTSTRDNCLGTECPRYRECHVMKARRDAMGADLVVVNHHLFFADMALRDSGVAELLPTVDAAVFDEAHQLVDVGTQFLGRALGTAQLIDLARDMLGLGQQQARGVVDWQALASRCDRAARELRLAAGGSMREVYASIKLRWNERAAAADFCAALEAVAAACDAAVDGLSVVSETSPDFVRLQARAQQAAQVARHFAEPPTPEHVRWIDLSAQQARLVEAPLDIREMLTEQRQAAPRAWVFTSATLGDDDGLRWFTGATGLEDAHKLRVGSPFDYAAHARLWIPPRFPKPNESRHPEEVGRLAARCAQALGGRTFVLTTTLRAMQTIAQSLRDELSWAGGAIEVLVQGQQPKRSLIQQFLARPASVLVGSQSFWEGIDVPGDALQCVLIDKLPFPPPNDPLVEARVKRIENQGGNAFSECFVADAAISLKQGAGRLIRSETDHGLLVVCDPRMAQMNYGRRLRSALPPMTQAASEEEALDWLRALALHHDA
ncbi:ATP-dependent DNA helicase [Aquincola sp. MAHUQ-54]|uniref:ATP-dependent DNA helicase n=1 Tax=Aquincola agrisoli TaxID=3119538 RepID=A0AAW9QIV1_9BURK